MSNTAATVTVGGKANLVTDRGRETITDVTVTTNSETVTAAQLGLSAIFDARADVQTGQATDTGTYVTCTIATGSGSITLATFTAAGVAATVAASTVIRVRAIGY